MVLWGPRLDCVPPSLWKKRCSLYGVFVASLLLVSSLLIIFSRPEVGSLAPRPHVAVVVEAYSFAKGDRFGSSILDMLGADAYAFSKHWTYVGACRTPQLRATHYRRFGQNVTEQRDLEKDKLLERLGITHWLHYGVDCPPPDDENGGHSIVLLENELFRSNPFQLFSEEYLQRLRRKLHRNNNNNNNSDGTKRSPTTSLFTVAVHLRRGDITVCHGHSRVVYRYLPNVYYLRILDGIEQKELQSGNRSIKVNIYTEPERPDALESLQEFRDRGYNIIFGGDELEVWNDMINADAFVMSDSYFSGFPAILKTHGEIYFPPRGEVVDHEMTPLRGWHVPTKELTALSNARREQMRLDNCPNNLHDLVSLRPEMAASLRTQKT